MSAPTPAAEHHRFWRDLLADAEGTHLPQRAASAEAGPAGAHAVPVPAPLCSALRDRADQLGVPVWTVLLAAHVAVVGFVAGTADILTGYDRRGPAGGDGMAEDAEHGDVAGTVPVRVPLTDGESWAELVAAVRKVELAVLPHRGYPLAEIKAAAGDRGELFETGFRFVRGEEQSGEHAGEPGGVAGGHTGLPLRAEFSQHGPAGGIRLQLRYLVAAYRPDQIERFGGYYRRALDRIAQDVSAARRWSELLGAEEEQLLRGFSGPEVALPEGTFADLFDRQVRADPQRVALTSGEHLLTYGALDRDSERIAAYLLANGVRPGSVVTTMLPRDAPWAVTVLALLKAGGVYLPQELDYPPERVASVLRRSGCRHIIADRSAAATLRTELRKHLADIEVLAYEDAKAAPAPPGPVPRPAPTDPAYIIFTSGSTGEPKGAVIHHSGMLNHLLAKVRDLQLGPDDRIAQIATQCFDISIWQLLVAWICGASTRIYSRFDLLDVPGFLGALADDRVSVLEVVPSYLDLLLAEAERRATGLPRLRLNIVTGEPLPPTLTHRWFARYPGVPMVNAYGPTEASDDVTHHSFETPVTDGRVPVGRPIMNTGIHVVDADDSLRPLGSYGEICVTGAGVGLGYINDEARTVAVFQPNPLDHRSETLYRTGDIGRWLPGGILDCAGRRDDQVKVRGYRIELSDVDTALGRLPGVDTAVTLARELDGAMRLVTYYVGSAAPDLVEFQRRLGGILPTYMHPEKVVRLEAFPLTARGKVDRAALMRV